LRPSYFLIASLVLSFLFHPFTTVHAQAEPPVVRAVLFYSPTCGHCEYVIQNVLPPLVEQYGDQLEMVGIDVTQQQGQALFMTAMQKYGFESAGVPFLVINDTVLIGSTDIPEKFPGLIKIYLAQGGTDWPDIPGLAEVLKLSPDTPEPTGTPVPVVHAVLFYQGTCSHCQRIVQEVVPPLQEKYGNQLEIFGVDISNSEEYAIYEAAVKRFKITKIGVPTFILGDQVLVGGIEIQEQFPSSIEGYFEQGGMDWPDIPGLTEALLKAKTAQALTASPPRAGTLPTMAVTVTVSPASGSPTATPGILGIQTETTNWRTSFAQDLAGNTLSVLLLLGMLGAIVWTVLILRNTSATAIKESWAWIIALLSLIGFMVAGYLAYVETLQVAAVCGPIGDCNTVQQSEYAHLFGVLPVGVLGLAGYSGIFIAWLVARYAKGLLSDLAVLVMFIMSAVGTLFSIYLTFLEPFVIGASCAWCLTSASIMTLLMLLSVHPAKAAYARLSQTRSHPLQRGSQL
jgi:uncharacterized membrane protein/thiol-disulfide isomerase/thioredoxin